MKVGCVMGKGRMGRKRSVRSMREAERVGPVPLCSGTRECNVHGEGSDAGSNWTH